MWIVAQPVVRVQIYGGLRIYPWGFPLVYIWNPLLGRTPKRLWIDHLGIHGFSLANRRKYTTHRRSIDSIFAVTLTHFGTWFPREVKSRKIAIFCACQLTCTLAGSQSVYYYTGTRCRYLALGRIVLQRKCTVYIVWGNYYCIKRVLGLLANLGHILYSISLTGLSPFDTASWDHAPPGSLLP